jgi:hypothetical protein
MTKQYMRGGLACLFILLMYSSAWAQTLLHYWNFNDNSSLAALTAPAQSVGGAALTAIAGGISTIDVAGGTGQNFNVENLNARNGDAPGTHLRFNDPIGGQLQFDLPTSGYEQIVVQMATRRSGSGAGLQLWSYTVDGSNYLPFDTLLPNNGNPALAVLDFSAVAGVSDNANFKLRVAFEQGPGGTVGNNRFDNVTVDGQPIGGGDTVAPVVSITPADGATNVAVSVLPTISFNEPVRLIDDSPITNDNAAQLAELRLGDANGAPVAFAAFFENNTLTLQPAAALANGQSYYVALLPDRVEDASDNAVAAGAAATFTTIALQTPLQAGDLLVVAYRMNASGAEDEVALLSLVDIEGGTFVYLTDAKYTSNAQPQCAGGIVWTLGAEDCLPAGSVISIQTSALQASVGTVTGSGFGLSSGGDQVLVYTGSAAAPNYITALTSNGWVETNTNCGGSLSMLPAGLQDGLSALNTSTAPGQVNGNAVNAYYAGPQTGTAEALRAAVLDAANWLAVGGGTAPQQWPAWNFPGGLKVEGVVVLSNTSLQVTFNRPVAAASAENPANYSGPAGLLAATAAGNTVTLTYASPFAAGVAYTLLIEGVADSSGQLMLCPYTFAFSFNTTVAFAATFVKIDEAAGALELVLNLGSPGLASVDLVVKPAPFSTADAADVDFTSRTLNFDGSSGLTQTVSIPVIDDAVAEQQAEYLVLSLENPVGLTISGQPLATVYIIDNDRPVPAPSQQIELQYVGSFDPSGSSSSTCEIVAYDAASRRLFTTSAVAGLLDIVDFSNPASPVTIASVDMNVYGGITSVAVHNGIVAVASPNADETLDGSVVFLDTNGNFIRQLPVGALPDMVTFTPDGSKVLTANEGQPNADYSVDPEGSVSIIDLSAGLANAVVNTLLFTDFNAQEAALRAAGVRKLKLSSTMSQDFEPEFITVSANSQKAWVSLQENNAVAEIDLLSGAYTGLWALGTKDMSLPGNGFDASDNNNQVLIANWPVKAFFIPDAVANYTVDGTTYLVTANEGDEKEYTGFEERTTVGNAAYALDETLFPQAAVLKQSFNLGRFRVTNLNGDLDSDGRFEEINCVGTRSFSIFNANTQQLVYDSGDDFERFTAANYPTIFNADHESNTPKVRSRAKGPEPEGVTLATIAGQTFAFIALERIGGVMVYNITDPGNPVFVDYKNSRSTSAYAGDHGAEGILYIAPADSPTDRGYILVSNEISGTLTIYEVDADALSAQEQADPRPRTFALFPNPVSRGQQVYFNRATDIQLFDNAGRLLQQARNALTLDTSALRAGLYYVKTAEGLVAALVVQ